MGKSGKKGGNHSKILRQLLTPILLVIFILTVAIVSIMGIVFFQRYQKQLVSDCQAENSLLGERVEAFLSEAYTLSEELANSNDILSMDPELQVPVLVSSAQRNDYMELLYVQDETGMQIARSSGENGDRSERWWFQKMLEEKEPFISKSYYSVSTNMPCASVFLPMYREEQFLGVFGADIKLESLASLATEYSDTAQHKTVFFLDGEGNIVAHPDKTYIEELYNFSTYTKVVSVKDNNGNVMKDADGNIMEEEQPLPDSYTDSFRQMIQNVMNGQDGSEKIKMDDGVYYASYSPILLDGSSESWSVVTLQKRSALMHSLYLVLLLVVLLALAGQAGMTFFVIATVRRITNPIVEITDIIGVASEGDFSVKASVSNNTEIGELANSFNHMTDKVSRVLGETMRLLVDVKGSSEKLTYISEETESVVNEMSEISDGAVSQLQDMEHMVSLTEQLTEYYERLLEMSAVVVEGTRETNQLSDEGIASVTELKKKSEESMEAVQFSYEKVLEFSESSQQIGSIIQEINNITRQTGLLALNASIEAARAGEAGKGFAVVAGEVSELANNSSASTEHIERIINQLQQQIDTIVQEIDRIKLIFSEQMRFVEEVDESFRKFRTSSENSRQAGEQVGYLVDTADEINKTVVSTISSIHEISKKTEENARNVSQRMSVQKEDIVDITKKVENMNKASEILNEEMSKFTLE